MAFSIPFIVIFRQHPQAIEIMKADLAMTYIKNKAMHY